MERINCTARRESRGSDGGGKHTKNGRNGISSSRRRSRNVVEEGVCAGWLAGGGNLKFVVDLFVGSRHTC